MSLRAFGFTKTSNLHSHNQPQRISLPTAVRRRHWLFFCFVFVFLSSSCSSKPCDYNSNTSVLENNILGAHPYNL
ncbi:hypothetical protein V6N12_004115 [Hibiscus sabdariffa]|uniref:Uncharacterized protein n=1 Tax=Hibiscus sabdariffa TaxID=183260 RepID=A0ABR2CKI2_9ROSI